VNLLAEIKQYFYRETVGKQKKFKGWMALNSLHRQHFLGGVILRIRILDSELSLIIINTPLINFIVVVKLCYSFKAWQLLVPYVYYECNVSNTHFIEYTGNSLKIGLATDDILDLTKIYTATFTADV
jgi:hypothetical protein